MASTGARCELFGENAKKEPPCQESGSSGWDIGKLPIMMITLSFSFVNRSFWRKKGNQADVRRILRKSKIFVKYLQKSGGILFKASAICYNMAKDKGR